MWSPVIQVFNQESHLPPQATASNAAFNEYRLGRELWQQRTLPAALEAVACFERAIQHDPKFALAYAAQADIQQTLLNYNYAPTMQLLSAALNYAEKAVALDGSLPECHVARAAALQNLWHWQDSDGSYQAAIQKHPKFARAYDWYAGFLLQFGRSDEALNLARIGLDLDPFHYPSHSNYGFYLWNAGRTREAAGQLESVLARTDLIYAHNVLGQVYADLAASSPEPDATEYYLRSLREAETVRTRDIQAAGGTDPGYLKWSDLIFVQAHGARKDRPAAQYYLNRLERGFMSGKISATAVAWAHAALNDRRRALELLEYGIEHHEREMLYAAVTPRFTKLHGEPRFQRILSRMKLA
jgi:Tfp pilus assembly protein PilF